VNEIEVTGAVFSLNIFPVPLQSMCAASQEKRMQTIWFSLGCQSGFLTSYRHVTAVSPKTLRKYSIVLFYVISHIKMIC